MGDLSGTLAVGDGQLRGIIFSGAVYRDRIAAADHGDAVAVQAEGQILLDLQHILRVDVCAQVIVAALRDRGLQVGQAPYRVESDQRLLRVVADVLVRLATEAVLVFRGGRLDGCACSEMRCIFNRHSM